VFSGRGEMNKHTPECPFCGRIVSRPDEIRTEFGDVLGGKCECGTVYVCDPGGHNTGEAYMEALALAKGDWQITEMDSRVDYEAVDIDYDIKSHQRMHSKGHRSLSGRLVFIKMKKQQSESFELSQGTPAEGPVISRTITEGSKMKRKAVVKKLLESRAYDEVADMARQDKGVISWLISLTYDKQDVISWRAIEAIGVISRALSNEKMDVMRDTVRRLLWSMGEESGGIGWSAAEMLGEIITGDPDSFNDIIPILWSFKDEDMFRAGIVWAMGRIAMIRPDLVAFIVQDLQEMLEDRNPVVRGYAVRVTGILPETLNAGNYLERISKLLSDSGTVQVYSDGYLLTRTVGDIAGEVLHKLGK
jgi:hypothetical protein